jgi:hypothetical protein
MVSDLERWRALNLEHTNKQVREAWSNKKLHEAGTLGDELRVKLGDIDGRTFTPQEILPHYLNYLQRTRPEEKNSLIDTDPCGWQRDARYIFDNMLHAKPLRQSFIQGFREKHTGIHFGDWEVGQAIAAVVEAIDMRQRSLYMAQRSDSRIPFAGGFALSTASDIAYGIFGNTDPMKKQPIVARPRRCWLMPLCIAGFALQEVDKYRKQNNLPGEYKANDGHILLAVLQEQGPPVEGHPQYRISLFDSHPILANARPKLYDMAITVARTLQWTNHRTIPIGRFKHRQVPVPQQTTGGYQCGLHVIVNAWILAMGLRIYPKAEYTDAIYAEAWEFARAAMAGILDWKPLVAWFFCRGLTMEDSIADVPVDRRFELSVLQQSNRDKHGHAESEDPELWSRIGMTSRLDDVPLQNFSIEQAPYDYSSNIKPPVMNVSPGPGLNRECEDVDIDLRSDEEDDIPFPTESDGREDCEMVDVAPDRESEL